MPDFVISEFGGLNTKKEDPSNGIVLPTKIAKNVDLRGGIIKPFSTDKILETGRTGEIAKYGNNIVSGNSNYVTLTLNGFDMLIYKDKASGKWKRAVKKPTGDLSTSFSVDNLSQTTPAKPTLQPLPNDTTKVRAEAASVGWFYEMAYVITFVRSADGYRDESAPSDISIVQSERLGFRVQRPAESGANIIGWNIYRLSTGYRATGSFQKVAEVGIGQNYFDDYTPGSELNGTLKGIFSDDGVTVLRQPAPVDFDGMCSRLYYGQTVAWKDETLYISEPNQPESYPAQYQIPCSSRVLSVEAYGGDLYAFTENGVQRIVGDNPITASILPDYIGHRVSSRRGTVSTEYGLFYAYKTGIARVTGSASESISRNLLGEEYFKSIDMKSVHLAYGDGILYIFHSKGTLLFIQERGIGFIELTNIYDGAYYDRKNGVIVATRNSSAWELFEGTGVLTVQYRQDGLVLNQPDDKRYSQLRVFGTGKFNCILYLEGKERNRRVLDLDGMPRDRIINFAHGRLAREASWELTGTGRITEIKAVLNG